MGVGTAEGIAVSHPDDHLVDCIDAAFSAARGDEPWDAVLTRLTEAFPGTKVAIISQRQGTHSPIGVVQNGYDAKAVSEFLEHYVYVNPWRPYFGSTTLLAPAVSDDIYPSWMFRDHEFYDGFLKPVGEVESAASIKLFEDDEHFSMLTIHYGERIAERYNKAVPRFLSRLAPHLQNAVAITTELELARNMKRSMVEQAQVAAFLLDPQGVVRDANEKALQLLDGEGGAALGEDGTLQIVDLVARAELAARLKSPAVSPVTTDGAYSPAMAGWRFMQFPQAVADQRLGWLPRANWTLALYDGSRISQGIDARVAQFRLTQKEAEISRRLVDGVTLKEAAYALGITYNTARQHLKAAFQKTGARRQADLVSRLLSPEEPSAKPQSQR